MEKFFGIPKLSVLIFLSLVLSSSTVERARDNGDIYIVNDSTYLKEHRDIMPTTESIIISTTVDPNQFDYEDILALCNSSFSIPMAYFIAFNTTAELPDIVDKTGMCFVRCFYEKSGIIDNWKLNKDIIRVNIFPATDDILAACEKEGAKEINPCIRTYAIAKCLTLRALEDATSPTST